MNNVGYYYDRLSANGKAVYKALFLGIKSFSSDIKLPLVSNNEISVIFDYVLKDNPLIFYAASYTITSNARECRLSPDYIYSTRIIKQYTDDIMRYLQKFDAVKNKTDIDKELYVHDFCLNNFKYDYTFGEFAYSVLGLVLKGTAVCEGIAKFVKLALDYLGVKCLLAHGNASDPVNRTDGPHAWNIVKIFGQAFHLDVTFDLTQKTIVNRYDYFNLPDEEIKKDHSFSKDFPRCVTTGKDYYSMHKMAASNPTELGAIIEYNLRQGKKIIVVKLKNIAYTADAFNKVITLAQQQYSSLYNKSFMVEVRYNPTQMVFEIEYT